MGALARELTGEGVGRAAPVSGGQPDFEALLGPAAWARLPPAVRRRFGMHVAGSVVRYAGRMRVRASRTGWLLAQLCRLIGTPLAPWTGEDVAVDVDVRCGPDGLTWDRSYRFDDRAPVLVSSRKAADAAGLVEMVRGGIGMALEAREADGALHFHSTAYLLVVGRLRLVIPTLLTPGRAHVIHQDLGGGRFRFALDFHHPWLGETFYQDGVFSDPTSTDEPRC